MSPFSVQFAANSLAELDAHVLEYADRIPRAEPPPEPEVCPYVHDERGPSVWELGEAIRATGYEVDNQVAFLHNFVDQVAAHGWGVQGQLRPSIPAQGQPTPADIAAISSDALAAYSTNPLPAWTEAQCVAFLQKLGELLQSRSSA